MAILDFREIPEAGKASGQQDTFELFAREVLELMGFKIIQGPSRGADGGKDLIVEETRIGVVGSTTLRWLVSCKHLAFSGKSVRPDDERNVFERVNAAGCGAFLGFYSTLPSSGLSELLHRQSTVQVKILDHEEIERHLLNSPEGRQLIQRYFPLSEKKLKHQPAEIFSDPARIECENCGKDLLNPPTGVWVIWYAVKSIDEGKRRERYVDMHFSCKGQCDRIMKAEMKYRHVDLGTIYDRWDDISDMAIPTAFIKQVMGILNGLHGDDHYEPNAFKKMKHLLLATFPLISRHLNDEDRRQLERLHRIPSFLGGMGSDE